MKSRQSLGIACKTCAYGNLCLAKDLRDLPFMDELDASIEYVKLFEPNSHLYFQNSPMKYIFAIHSGVAKDYSLDANGDLQINEFYFPGDILALEFIEKGIYQLSAVAVKPVVACMIPLSVIEKFNDIPEFKKRIMDILCLKLENQRYYAIHTNVKCRIAAFFFNHIRRKLERSEYTNEGIELDLTFIDISNKIGISNETFSRVIKEFGDNKIFRIEKNKIYNVNMEELRILARILN